MATDMLPLLHGISSQNNPGVPDARDRQAPVQNQGGSRKFDSLLERAEAPHASIKEGSPSRTGSKPTTHSRASHASPAEPRHSETGRPTATATSDRAAGRSEESCAKDDCVSDKRVDRTSTEEPTDHPDDQTSRAQEMILAALLVPAPVAHVQGGQVNGQTDLEANDSVDAAGKVTATVQAGGQDTPQTQMAASASSVPLAAEVSTGNASPDVQAPKQELKMGAEKEQAGEGTIDVSALTQPADQRMNPEAGAHRMDASFPESKLETGAVTTVAAVVTPSKPEAGPSKQAVEEQADRSSFLDAISRDSLVSNGPEASNAGTFLEKESQPFSDSSAGGDRAVPNQAVANGAVDRPLFLDRMQGQHQEAPSINQSASGRNDTGQSASVLRAADSERLNELRSNSSVSQSVMLDLDPLDMGPLRVRVMMSDQTVHAHIRTEHGELGQGLLQQGQSLESSLRTTGLEMGMLRVTVDQQQGRSDNAWTFQQQQQGHPAQGTGTQASAGEAEGSVRTDHGQYTSERVSIFA